MKKTFTIDGTQGDKMDDFNRWILDLDLKHLTEADKKRMHDAKAAAIHQWAERETNRMKGSN